MPIPEGNFYHFTVCQFQAGRWWLLPIYRLRNRKFFHRRAARTGQATAHTRCTTDDNTNTRPSPPPELEARGEVWLRRRLHAAIVREYLDAEGEASE